MEEIEGKRLRVSEVSKGVCGIMAISADGLKVCSVEEL